MELLITTNGNSKKNKLDFEDDNNFLINFFSQSVILLICLVITVFINLVIIYNVIASRLFKQSQYSNLISRSILHILNTIFPLTIYLYHFNEGILMFFLSYSLKGCGN